MKRLPQLRTWQLLGALIFAAWSSLASGLGFADCRQNGGNVSCDPLLDNGWEYYIGGPDENCQGIPFFGKGPDLFALLEEMIARENAANAACLPPGVPLDLWVPGACVPIPTRFVYHPVWVPPPGGFDIEACTCDMYGSLSGFRNITSAFRKAHPYCAPHFAVTNGVLDSYCTDAWYCWPQGPIQGSKNLGAPACGLDAGNPINIATGNKYQREVDYVRIGPLPLSIIRHYNSNGPRRGLFGISWRGDFERSIQYDISGPVAVAFAFRPDGKIYQYTQSGSSFVGEIDVPDRLIRDVDVNGNTIGWRYKAASDETEVYDPSGRLLQVSDRSGRTLFLEYDQQNRLSALVDSFGRSISLTFDQMNRIAALTDPDGQTYRYQYTADGMLSQVTYPGGAFRTYIYNELVYTSNQAPPTPVLTGIIDENGDRFAIFRYDSDGQAISSGHVATGGVEVDRYDVSNRSTPDVGLGHATVTDPLGTMRTHTFQTSFGTARNTAISQPCPTCGSVSAATVYDANTGAVISRTDFNGVVTTYQYADPYGRNDLETQRTEAFNRPEQRTISTQWHPTLRLPSSISEPAPGGTKTTTFTYDGSGNLTQKSIVAPKNDGTATTVTRTWSWTYGTLGRVLSATDPDNHAPTTYNYYSDTDPDPGKRGNIQTITNPAGHVTRITAYDAHGRPLSITDPNGLVTTLAYDLRGRLESRQVGVEVTDYDYDGVGQLIQVTLPDGSFVYYSYDTAHRLIEIEDGLQNRIVYTLDAMGNRTQEDSYFHGTGPPTKTHGRRFDALNRLSQELNAMGQVVAQYSYDGNGNLRQTTIKPDTTGTHDEPTINTYDGLNRLLQVLDAVTKTTGYAYDSANNLTQVRDARTLTTTYGYDGLNNLVQQVSPDTGTTTSTYDAAGNLLTRIDARGATATYTYDNLNRVTQVVYSKTGAPNETHTFVYDVGASAKGRLEHVTDTAATTNWTYNSQGRVAGKTQQVGGVSRSVSYGYNSGGQLATITTPSGQVIGYGYANNRVNSITINGQPLLSAVITEPFGPIAAWNWSNGLFMFRDYDNDGRLATWEFRDGASLLRKDQSFDLAGRILAIADPNNPAASQSYQYDLVDRLTVAQSGNPVAHTEQFTYDAVGNRRSVGTDGTVVNLGYGTTSNQLQLMAGAVSPTYFNGATSLDFTYNNANRLVQTQSSGTTVASYVVNALGQRVSKTVGGVTTIFVYDEQGHLLGEYDGTDELIEETIWLEDLPVATLRPTGAPGTPTPINVFYVHADHLGSPRAVTRPADNALMWQWDNLDPFGTNSASENPAGQGTFTYNLRFPGQYYDAERGLAYNMARNYDASIGRYVESDPIGLFGGINTYAYVRSNPLQFVDPEGLKVQQCCRKAEIQGLTWVDHCWLKTDTITAGMASSPQCRAGVGNDYEYMYKTDVYVSDHSCDQGDCVDVPWDVDEDCVNRELRIGQYLGRFTGLNNCQTFLNTVLNKCTKVTPPPPKRSSNPKK